MSFRNKILHGHVLEVLNQLPSDSVDVVITSPPYWGLRDYGKGNITIWDGQTKCQHQWEDFNYIHHPGQVEDSLHKEPVGLAKAQVGNSQSSCVLCGAWRGQLGLEPHPQMFIDHLVEIFNKTKRLLKSSGSLWVVIGDSYFGGKGKSGRKDHTLEERLMEGKTLQRREWTVHNGDAPQDLLKQDDKWFQPKQKMLIPERFAIAMQESGWILRNVVIWHKVNHMPASVRDRLTNSYEPVFFFVKNQHYYFDLDAIRKPYPKQTIERCQRSYLSNFKVVDGNFNTEKHVKWAKKVTSYAGKFADSRIDPESVSSPRARTQRETKLGKDHDGSCTGINQKRHSGYYDNEGNLLVNIVGANPGDVWSLTTEAFKGKHFATFPTKLVRKVLLAAAPKQICSKCGKPRTRIVQQPDMTERPRKSSEAKYPENKKSTGQKYQEWRLNNPDKFMGWSKCDCDVPFQSGLVLDPFCGSGTTLLVAHKMGLDWLGIDLNSEYCKIAEKRILEHGNLRLDKFISV